MNRVLVTGGTGGAGGGVIEAFAEAGWRIAGTTHGKPPKRAADASAVHWLRADLADTAGAESAVRRARRALGGGLDALVCLVGGYEATPVDELSWTDVDRLLQLDLRPTVEAVIAARSALEASGKGSIVTVGARSALVPGSRMSAYAAAKAGVIAFSAAVAVELRASGVRVNCVLPGTIDTPANREMLPDAKRANWVQPRQLGELIRFLASPDSAPLTGAAIPIG
jgi:NAD(P)-dependent dehydrogenase (short-subunit alcohol dehydrogenase family)